MIEQLPARIRFTATVLLALTLVFGAGATRAERIKDIAGIAGVRTNQLIGYGLVIGLDGTGDQTSQTPFTVQSLISMLSRYGVQIPPGTNTQVKNIAAVMVHTDLPAFAKPGQTVDVTVSSLGNAKSLRGGSLLFTPLRGADNQVYAIAQGSLVVGGFGIDGSDGSRVSVNVPSVGRIPNGATVERSVASPFARGDAVFFNLHTADFTTARRMADAINDAVGPETAQPVDAMTVRVSAPRDVSQRVGFVAFLEDIQLQPGEAPARVIVNSRTGTIVIGSHVRVKPAAVTHGSLSVSITSNPLVSQPEALSLGRTEVVERSDIEVTQDANRMFLFDAGVSLQEIVQAVNEVGAAPGDLIAILEALKQVGALRAQLIVI